jgi:hypothetical protein
MDLNDVISIKKLSSVLIDEISQREPFLDTLAAFLLTHCYAFRIFFSKTVQFFSQEDTYGTIPVSLHRLTSNLLRIERHGYKGAPFLAVVLHGLGKWAEIIFCLLLIIE